MNVNLTMSLLSMAITIVAIIWYWIAMNKMLRRHNERMMDYYRKANERIDKMYKNPQFGSACTLLVGSCNDIGRKENDCDGCEYFVKIR